MRKIYLEDKPLIEAQQDFLRRVTLERKIEWIPTQAGLGRVTAQDIYAKVSMPNFHAAAMDGIAVRAEQTFAANELNPIRLQKEMDYRIVDTGDPIPPGFDAVIMVEDLHPVDGETVEIREAVAPWQHIRPIGEDVIAGEMLFPAFHRLRPVDLGALLAGGILTLPVLRKPSVAIMPTGTELIPPSEHVESGQIIEFNSTVFSAYLKEWGAEPTILPIVKDEYEAIREKVREAVEHYDLVLLNAGSSAGTEDFTYHVIHELGTVFTHGVGTRPGKPVVLGEVSGKPFVGLPGYPVSAYFGLEWFVRPLLYRYYGLIERSRPKLRVKMGRRVVSVMGAEDFVRMTVGFIQGQYVANPLTRAAGVTMSLVRADGLLRIPPSHLGYEQGEEAEIELYRPVEEIERSILITGSHDLSLDLLQSHLRRRDPLRHIISSHVGSMGGILAIQKGEAHVAGIHLFDEKTGRYNIPFLEKYLKGKEAVLVHLTYRTQGWIVAKGNPHKINDVTDIVNKRLTYINRQRGAGTRLLFDDLLRKKGISKAEVYGYEQEAISHLSVAVAVQGGAADVGLGIYSAAKVMDLDFIPVAEEHYELLFLKEFYESEAGKLLIEIITSSDFRRELESLGGYDLRDAGKVVYVKNMV